MNKSGNISIKLSWIYLTSLGFIALIAPFFMQGKSFPYLATYMDLEGTGGVKPGVKDHFLGTDLLGKDVLSGLISGANVSLQVSLYAVIIALTIAIVLVISTSYIGNKRLKLNLVQLVFIAFFTFFSIFYAFIAFPFTSMFSLVIRISIVTIFMGLILYFNLRFFSGVVGRKFTIPLDEIGMKFYELFYALPKLIFILLVMGLSPKSGILQLAVLMGLLLWPVFYRYLRLEVLQVKSTERYTALRNLGLGDGRIIVNHVLPSVIQAISTPLLFTIISAILIEATLSFLGIGVGGDTVTWGKMLTQARLRVDAWWLAVFPGALIFFTLLSLHTLLKKYVEE